MNLFEIIMLDTILILFPLMIYVVFLSADKKMKHNTKKVLFSFFALSSFYFVYRYSPNNIMINILMMNSLLLISYLNKHYALSIIISLLTVFVYITSYQSFPLMIIPYVFLILTFYFRNKVSHLIVMNMYLLVYFLCFIIWVTTFNSVLLNNLSDFIFIMAMCYMLINIVYFLYNEGEAIVNYHINYKKLKENEQLRLSLFKITHEIKNPIAVIKAYLDMLNVKDEKQVTKYIPIIKSEIDRLLILLQDFMLVNQSNMDMDIMDINMLIEEVIDKLRPILEENSIELSSHLIDDEIYIEGDYKRLSQVLINMIKNSIEAMDKERKKIQIEEVITNDKIDITIKDNGSGISKEDMHKIKQPFYTTKKRGTGLGVSLSSEIIQAHQGLLDYKSKEGIGTVVSIQLPLNRKDDNYFNKQLYN